MIVTLIKCQSDWLSNSFAQCRLTYGFGYTTVSTEIEVNCACGCVTLCDIDPLSTALTRKWQTKYSCKQKY